MDVTTPRFRRWALSLTLSIALALAVGAVGGLATASSIPDWYAGLRKPSFNPPNWVFGPVWTTLYVLMALAASRIDVRAEGRARGAALVLYAVQLTLNLAWSLIFFGLRAPGPALMELAVLLPAILATALAFWRLDRTAGLLLAPYALWCSFAFVLNFEIWRLNPAR
ncbi:MAG TPA: TspO/MBR family protein [Caulobacteraceae bacterium]|nr:TspO/MBR family protein [Caulobacteraceae bacterium]